MHVSKALPTFAIHPFPSDAWKTNYSPFLEESGWQQLPVGKLRYSMGQDILRPLPTVKFRIAYDKDAFYLLYDVKEYAVRAVAERHGDMVCQDSCVEFFFSPSEDISAGYFNLEMNCGGTALLHYHPAKGKKVRETTASEFRSAEIRTSLPKIVDPELKGPLRWTLEARIPFKLLQKIHPFPTPEPNTVWQGNFFKCADKTSRPHWLTWAEVDHPTPAFHIPKSFGKLEFSANLKH